MTTDRDAAPYPPLDGTEPCGEVDPDLFFVDPSDPGTVRQREMTLDLCRTCPVIAECLAYALTNNVIGIWGGTTHFRRNQLRRQYGITARVVTADPYVPRRQVPA